MKKVIELTKAEIELLQQAIKHFTKANIKTHGSNAEANLLNGICDKLSEESNAMYTRVNNIHRRFMVTTEGFSNRQIVCNLSDIPFVIKNYLEKNDRFTIREHWNQKWTKRSKNFINGLFEANQIEYRLKS